MPREHLSTAVGTFMLRRKVWETVRGHSSDLIQKERKPEKDKKKRPLCFPGFQPVVGFLNSPSKFAAQGNKTCCRRLYVSTALLAVLQPHHVSLHNALGGSLQRHQLMLTQAAEEKKRIGMIHPVVLGQAAPFGFLGLPRHRSNSL